MFRLLKVLTVFGQHFLINNRHGSSDAAVYDHAVGLQQLGWSFLDGI
jgi:hypothetical protein